MSIASASPSRSSACSAGAARDLDGSELGAEDAEWLRIAQEGHPAQTLWGTLPGRRADRS